MHVGKNLTFLVIYENNYLLAFASTMLLSCCISHVFLGSHLFPCRSLLSSTSALNDTLVVMSPYFCGGIVFITVAIDIPYGPSGI